MGMYFRLCRFIVIILLLITVYGCQDDNSNPADAGDNSNNPPVRPHDPIPADSSLDFSISDTLKWFCSDPEGDTLKFDLYLGTNNTPPLIANDLSQPIFYLQTLDTSTTYHWRVIASDGHENHTEGPLWTFTTSHEDGTPQNLPPSEPEAPVPNDSAVDVNRPVVLQWSCSDPEEDTLFYDFYIGTDSVPALAASHLGSATYNPGSLAPGQTYFWKIVAWDTEGNQTEGQTWQFSTKRNSPPGVVTILAPQDGLMSQPVRMDFSWSCFDPDGDQLTYDVYLGTSAAPGRVIAGHPTNSFDSGLLDHQTIYHWRIIAYDEYGDSSVSALWRFQTVELKNIAYITNGDLKIVDVSNPAQPCLIGNLETPGSAAGFVIRDDYIYLADYDNAFLVIDKSDPFRLEIVGSCRTQGEPLSVDVVDTIACIADGQFGIQIMDISDPFNPQRIGYHDTSRNGDAVAVSFIGNYAHVGVRGYGLNIFSLGDPRHPQRFAEDSTYGRAANDIVTQTIQNYGKFAYIADGRGGLQIYNVDNPHIPNPVGSFQTVDLAKGLCVYDRYVYAAIGNAGLAMVDVYTRSMPRRVGEIDTQGDAVAVAADMNYAYVIDKTLRNGNDVFYGGLRIVDISDAPYLEITGSLQMDGNPYDIKIVNFTIPE